MTYQPTAEDFEAVELQTKGYKPSASDFEEQSDQDERGFLSKLPANLLAGLAQMGHGFINTPHNLAGLISKKLASHIPYQNEFNYPEALGLPKKATFADELIRGLAEYAPAAALPAARLGSLSKGLESIPKVGGLLSRGASQVPFQAAYGATQNQNPLQGAEEGAIAGSLSPVLESALRSLRPSVFLRGKLSPSELLKNLESTHGTETQLGRVIESPSLNRLYENIMPHVLGSNTENVMQRNAQEIIGRGNKLMESLRGEGKPIENYGIELQNALKKAAIEARKEKNSMYGQLNEAADKAGLKIGRENFRKSARDLIADIDQSAELKAEMGSDLINDLKRYASGKEGNNLKLTNIFRGKLGDKANDFYRNGKMHEYHIINELKDSLSKDIDQAFENSTSKELKNLYSKSQKNYAENFAPFEDKDIVKFIRQGGDPDLILNHFVRGGQSDRANLVTKLQSQLEKKSSHLLPSAYFSKALNEEGQVNPLKFRALYQKLGKNQRKALITNPETRKSLENYSNLVGKNAEGFNLMFNPKTGARNTELLAKMAQLMGAGLTSGASGVIPGLGTLAGLASGSRVATKLLTSPKVRERLVNKMLKGNHPSERTEDILKVILQNAFAERERNNGRE